MEFNEGNPVNHGCVFSLFLISRTLTKVLASSQRHQHRCINLAILAGDARDRDDPVLLELYTNILSAVMVMGQDGVSSDESDTENGKIILKAKTLQWRIKMDNQLTLADNAKILRPELFMNGGAPAMARMRGGGPSDREDCPKMMPLAAVEQSYLRNIPATRIARWNLRDTNWKPKQTTEFTAGQTLER